MRRTSLSAAKVASFARRFSEAAKKADAGEKAAAKKAEAEEKAATKKVEAEEKDLHHLMDLQMETVVMVEAE